MAESKEYIQQSINQINLKKTRESGNREKDAEENERDDFDAGDITSIQFWSLDTTYHSNWREKLTIELTPEEAVFLKSQIVTNQRGSLFAFILRNNIPLDKYDSFAALTEDIKDSVDDDLRYMIELANSFNNLVAILTTRYNLIVFDGKNRRAQEKWDILSKDLKRRSEVDLKAVYSRLTIRNQYTEACNKWQEDLNYVEFFK